AFTRFRELEIVSSDRFSHCGRPRELENLRFVTRQECRGRPCQGQEVTGESIERRVPSCPVS
ncbi:hypothetical protein, partial [Mesorhizobium sp. M7A.F.Ca.CA.004.12.1.1]|uniref:hypothetical protein n=1 Tax=Mesorhizobium sp. M7A.F.Ca.CA.004.12.1.1 TaxID=2496732 RepID=UPI0019CF9D4B